jgi:hypothetical protein
VVALDFNAIDFAALQTDLMAATSGAHQLYFFIKATQTKTALLASASCSVLCAFARATEETQGAVPTIDTNRTPTSGIRGGVLRFNKPSARNKPSDPHTPSTSKRP